MYNKIMFCVSIISRCANINIIRLIWSVNKRNYNDNCRICFILYIFSIYCLPIRATIPSRIVFLSLSPISCHNNVTKTFLGWVKKYHFWQKSSTEMQECSAREISTKSLHFYIVFKFFSYSTIYKRNIDDTIHRHLL